MLTFIRNDKISVPLFMFWNSFFFVLNRRMMVEHEEMLREIIVCFLERNSNVCLSMENALSFKADKNLFSSSSFFFWKIDNSV